MSLTENANIIVRPNGPIEPPETPGQHPGDKSEYVGPGFGTNNPAPTSDNHSKFARGNKAYDTANSEALPVFQRASKEWNVQIVSVNAQNGGTALAAQKSKGRTHVILTVPSTLPNGGTPANGVTFAPSEGDLQGDYTCGVVDVGQTVTIDTENEVWVGLISGTTSGVVQVLVTVNPAQGGIL